MSDEIRRRDRIDQYTPAETAIREAMIAVEAAGCDPRLTDAVVLLGQAQGKVADFVDGVPHEEPTEPRVPTARPFPRLRPMPLCVTANELFDCLLAEFKYWSETESFDGTMIAAGISNVIAYATVPSLKAPHQPPKASQK